MKIPLLILLLTISLSAQEKVGIAIYQDARFLFVGDERGNEAGTLNFLGRVKLQGKQQKWGYMIVFPEYEYANLNGGTYTRYSVNVGYTFNRLLIKNFEASISGGWGWIKRGLTYHSATIAGELSYKLTDNLKINLLSQYTDRADIAVKRFSGFIGLEIRLAKGNTRNYVKI